MPSLRLLSLTDQLFLLLENRRQPMHVGGLFIFEVPVVDNKSDGHNKQRASKEGDNKEGNKKNTDDKSENSFVTSLVAQIREANNEPTYPFNQVLHNVAFWKIVTTFDINYHFRHIKLAAPLNADSISDDALRSYVSAKHEPRLDREYPLWECYLIEGSAPSKSASSKDHQPEQFALYFKIHHSLLDGVAAMKLLQKSLSTSADDKISLPPWALMSRYGTKDDLLPKTSNVGKALRKGIKAQIKATVPASKHLLNRVANRRELDFLSSLEAPKSILNQRISQKRKFMTHTYAIERLTRIAKNCDVSLNDAILALCSGALRRYLHQLDELPDKPLIAMIPTSMRYKDRFGANYASNSEGDNSVKHDDVKGKGIEDNNGKNNSFKSNRRRNNNRKNDNRKNNNRNEMGNQLAFVLCDLGTNLATAKQRLNTIHNSMNKGKEFVSKMTQEQFINYAVVEYGWQGVNLLTEIYPKKQAFNLIISNVAGSEHPLYWNGAKLKHIYPASIILSGLALNITITSYDNHLEFGIVACPEALPQIDSLLSALDEEMICLEQILDLED